MAAACQLPVTTFSSNYKSHIYFHRLAFPHSSSCRFSSPWSLPDIGNPMKREYAPELAERGALKWRTRVSFLPSFPKNKSREDVKQELLKAIAELDRGADATSEDQERVEQIARQLEEVNPIGAPLKSDLLNGKWELLYTTSRSILQSQRPKILRPFGKIYQAINADTLRAQNIETWPYFNQVTANLVPLNARKVAVKFDRFKIGGLIPVTAPGRELEITYLDEEIRISRGDKGNLFILKMVDRAYRIPS
ncbi:probable plastid-lipid-associated protein 4, chloroplastic [Phalaenopsis equestris]|uniref:probable plastid-lipid-associated protein 4, chloroplastic n=1 Tax=Phalaenopsis equestris TaxID=78828 RepID=UPI0009E42D73|nr:probable plastid-lipid-associated protein 4, chloroplastic [Phalaenopsis equestris]